jgi:hypothetical protein
MAPPLAPRLPLNPHFVATVRACRTPQYVLAQRCGFPAGHELASIFSADHVAATKRTTMRLRLLASMVGFAPDEIFAEDTR